MHRLFEQWKRDFFDAFEAVEDQSRRYLATHRRRIDWRLVGLIIVGCAMLTYLEYFGGSTDYHLLEKPLGLFFDNAGERLRYTFREQERARLARLAYWSGSTFVGYLLVPLLYVVIVMRRSFRDFGLGLGKTFGHSWIYVGLFAIVLPVVFAVSLTDSFQSTYPFYDQAGRSWTDFLLWQLVYGVQFMSLEFFYRGFLVHGLKHRFGIYAVLVSVIPYCMIHFGKPMPETLGAIFAGIALGVLALFTRSIWLGVAIHVSVAVSMDIFSLVAKGEVDLPF